MEVEKAIICRLCLNICQGGFKNIDRSTLEALNFLLLYVSLDVSQDVVICTTCTEDLKKCFNFKSDCLQRRNSKCMTIRNTDVSCQKAHLGEGTEVLGSFISNVDLCVFCMEMVNQDSSVLMGNKVKNIITTLEKHFPELNPNITEDSITCTWCYKSMQILVSFTNSCLVAEEGIQKYCNIEGTNSEGQIELTAVLNFTFKDQLKGPIDGYNVAKVEDCERLENEGEIEIKSEDYMEVQEHELSNIKVETIIKPEDDDNRSMDDIEQDTKIYRTKPPVLYKCHTCSYETYFKHRLQRHVLTHKDAMRRKLHACDMCPYWTDYKTNLRRHMLTHQSASEVTMHKCKICAFQTKHKQYVRQHMLIHENTPAVIMCPRQSKFTHHLQPHMLLRKNSMETTMHKCNICPYKAKYKYAIKRHMLSHKSTSEVRRFKCETCTFETKTKDALGRHRLTHKTTTEVEMHKCILCTFQTKYKSNLGKHMLVHKSSSEVSMFMCDMCPYQSKRKDHVRLHMLTHKNSTQTTMHKCSMCAFQTKYPCGLQRHMLQHGSSSKVEMFKCDMCPYQSKRKDHVRQHMRTHKNPTETTMHKCNISANIVM